MPLRHHMPRGMPLAHDAQPITAGPHPAPAVMIQTSYDTPVPERASVCLMFHTVLLSLIVPTQESPTPTVPVAGGHSTLSPTPNGNFPGGSLISQLVNYALYTGYAACFAGFIAGAATLWLSNSGRMGGSAHHYGVKALAGAVVGSMLLASITAFI